MLFFFSLSICKTSQELGKYFGVSEEAETELVDLDAIKLLSEDDVSAFADRGVTVDSAGFITNFSNRNPLVTVTNNATIAELTTLLKKTHRVVVTEEGKLVGYITQSDLVKHLYDQGKFTDKTVKELDIGSTAITTIKENQKVLEAFRDMAIQHTSGCAVVDATGKLVSSISSLDIRGVSSTGDLMDRLYWTYKEYFSSLQGELHIHPRGAHTTSPDTPLSEVVKCMVEKKRHHVYLVDEQERPVRVISLGDVLRFLSS